MNELNGIDKQVRDQLADQGKKQDASLQARLAARRKKRENAIEQEKKLKQDQLQERIAKSIENSEDYQLKKNALTMEALTEMVNKLKLELPEHEVPGALDKIIDEKHQSELEDLLLKLYEQKAVELKEEILCMMEAKIAKQQEVRQGGADRKKGIDALISRTIDEGEVQRLEALKKTIDGEIDKEIKDLEEHYRKAEQDITRHVQERCQNREVAKIDELQQR